MPKQWPLLAPPLQKQPNCHDPIPPPFRGRPRGVRSLCCFLSGAVMKPIPTTRPPSLWRVLLEVVGGMLVIAAIVNYIVEAFNAV